MPRIMSPEGKDFVGPKKVVQMGPPPDKFLNSSGSSVLDGPIKTAASYGERVKARQAKMAELKKAKVPVGGVPEVEAGKMREMAEALAQPRFGDFPSAPERAPVEPPPDMPQPSGVGSGYAVNRAMAEGQLDRPATMREAKEMERDSNSERRQRKELSPETVELLNKVKEETEAGGNDSQRTTTDGSAPEDLDDAEDEVVSRALQPPVDFMGVEEHRAVLISKERRDKIESRLSKLSISDMVMKRELIQSIPVIVDKDDNPELVYTLRTYRQHEYLHCLRHVYENPGSAFYVEELLNTCKMVCSLVSVNGAQLVEHRENVGQSNESVNSKLFEKKFQQVASFPVHIIADLSVQWAWFNDRINKLFSVADLKNG